MILFFRFSAPHLELELHIWPDSLTDCHRSLWQQDSRDHIDHPPKKHWLRNWCDVAECFLVAKENTFHRCLYDPCVIYIINTLHVSLRVQGRINGRRLRIFRRQGAGSRSVIIFYAAQCWQTSNNSLGPRASAKYNIVLTDIKHKQLSWT